MPSASTSSKAKTKTNRISHSKASKGYRHIDKDPMLIEVLKKIDESGMTYNAVAEKCGVASSTIRAWDLGKTRRPQRITMEFVLRACGYTLAIQRLQ
jgi:hypothetical protein